MLRCTGSHASRFTCEPNERRGVNPSSGLARLRHTRAPATHEMMKPTIRLVRQVIAIKRAEEEVDVCTGRGGSGALRYAGRTVTPLPQSAVNSALQRELRMLAGTKARQGGHVAGKGQGIQARETPC